MGKINDNSLELVKISTFSCYHATSDQIQAVFHAGRHLVPFPYPSSSLCISLSLSLSHSPRDFRPKVRDFVQIYVTRRDDVCADEDRNFLNGVPDRKG